MEKALYWWAALVFSLSIWGLALWAALQLT